MAPVSGISIGTDALPAILKILGVQPSADAGDTSMPDAVATDAGNGNAASAPPAVVGGETAKADSGAAPESKATKAGALMNLLSGNHPMTTDVGPPAPPPSLAAIAKSLPADSPVPVPAPDLASGQQSNVMPPADLSSDGLPGQSDIKATFAEAHPTLARILGIAATLGQGAAAGAGQRTFGAGFQQAQELPLDIAGKKAQITREQAQTDQLKSMITLPNGVTLPFALAKTLYPTLMREQGQNSRNQSNIDSRENIASGKNAVALRKQGLKLDDNGNQVAIPYEELSPAEQATVDLKQSQQDAAQAKAALDKAKNDPNSPAFKAAYGRLQVAQQNAATAAGKLGLDKDKFTADYFGIGPDGAPLPGSPTDESGNPIGARVANAGKPSADRIRRGDLAANAIHNLDNVTNIVQRRPELFGPVAGRVYTNVADMMGSNDPDIRAIGVEIHNYALASNGAHGVRSQQAIQKTEDEVLKNFHAGPQGIMGGIAAAKESLNDFVNDQQLGNRARPATNAAPKRTVPAQPQKLPANNKFGFVPLG